MTVSRASLSPSRIFVGDTCALVNEIFEGTRHGTLTSLLAALHLDAARLYIPRHVLDELSLHITADAQARSQPIDPRAAQTRWDTMYAPFTRVVDVPDDWARTDPRVTAVDNRHRTDTPFAQLAVTIGPSWVLTEDPDLITNDLGYYDRLPLLHAAANDAELGLVERAVTVPTLIGAEALMAASRGLRRLPAWAQLTLAAGAGLALLQAHRGGHLANGLRQIRRAAVTVGRAVLPPVATIISRHEKATALWGDREIAAPPDRSLPEQVAAVLARAPVGGLLAPQIARHIQLDAPLSWLVPMVREALLSRTAFTEVSRGRWMLGTAVTTSPPEISPELVADWLRRSHRHDLVLAAP